MDKEFVPYDIALAMKELGFDEPCFGYYAIYIKTVDFDLFRDCEWEHRTNTYWNSEIAQDESAPYTVAPLYQQAFRWFREKGYGFIDKPFYNSLKTPNITYVIDIIEWSTGGVANMAKAESYQEAQDACLRKLIEIVKHEKIK
jgi:hypothetical protein